MLDLEKLTPEQQAVLNVYDKVGKFDLKQMQLETLHCGLPTFDKNKVFTKKEGKLVTLGAHTSHGKSAALMQIAAEVSKTEFVAVHSYEMTTQKIETRLLSSISRIPTSMILNGSAAEDKIKAAREDYASRKLYVSNVPNRSLGYLQDSVFQLSQVVGGLGLVVVDYCQQVRPGGENKNALRVNEITDISAGLLQLAQQLKCNVVLGAQLNNEVLRRAFLTQGEEGEKEYVPIMSDIREGSSFAHDSAVVLMLVRPYVFDRKSPRDLAKFYCIKNRDGELWDAALKWDGSKTTFYENDNRVGL